MSYIRWQKISEALARCVHQVDIATVELRWRLRKPAPLAPNLRKVPFVVENGELEQMAERIAEAAGKTWDREHAVRYILDNHTWERRAEVYHRVIGGCFP